MCRRSGASPTELRHYVFICGKSKMFVPRVTKFGTSDDFEAPWSETDSGSKRSKVKVTSAFILQRQHTLPVTDIHQMARQYAADHMPILWSFLLT